ncbi:GYDIA family GHMP kinase [Flavobacteriaceae bacterium M23B6Z8]
MTTSFYSHGKLLITGEYAVLDGALCLALPTKKGQSLEVEDHSDGDTLIWTSLDHEGSVWFETKIVVDVASAKFSIRTPATKLPETTLKNEETLLSILRAAVELNPAFLQELKGKKVVTKLEFPENWGLGSSSTFINNVAQWAQVDAFQLLWQGFSGSGYDIACAQNDSPILYSVKDLKPKIIPITFHPPFKTQLYFVHLNQKQNSREGISHYRSRAFDRSKLVAKVSKLTQSIQVARNLSEFEKILNEHEETLGEALGQLPVKKRLFKDYSGAVKSLGAWGGDFVLVTGDQDSKTYFENKGFKTIIDFDTMIL